LYEFGRSQQRLEREWDEVAKSVKAKPKPAAAKKPPAKKPAAKKPASLAKGKAKAAPVPVEEPVDDLDVGTRDYDLVVVESPAKAKTINKYLGSSYKVLASYGHVRDLAQKKERGEDVAGIRIQDGWKLRYTVDEKGERGAGGRKFKSPREILNEIGKAAKRADRVLLASDPDREGESIAWHIADELKLPPKRTFRIRFNEITKTAVQKALSEPEEINMDRVKAQEARRAMDRVVGFPLSNLLAKKVTRGLSAGRVQSVAVKLIVDREAEIEAFKADEYWKLTALLAPQGSGIAWTADLKKTKIFAKKKGEEKTATPPPAANPDDPDAAGPELNDEGEVAEEKGGIPDAPKGSFLAELARWNGAEVKIGNEANADEVLAALKDAAYVVTKIDQKDRQERPQPPFITSTLQQQANIRLRFGTSRTMQTAQKLYEGVELGAEGSVALITYMRTDSTRVSDDALKMVRGHVQATFGERYLPEKPNVYASGKSAQEAHEAVRPTDLTQTPQKIQPFVTADQFKLYKLIYDRFVASQMAPALFAVTSVEVTAGPGLFRATGRIEKFDGFRKVMPPAGKQEDVTLPSIQEQQQLDRLDLFATQHFTQPPPRFNEASLVKAMEKEGIGRPSTYASIINVIQNRGYVEQKERRFYATDIGKIVTKLLVDSFPNIMDLKFTSHFEEELDEIETGKFKYAEVLDEFWEPFQERLKIAQADMPSQRNKEIGEACPKCGRPLVEQLSAKTKGKFIGCSGWNDKEAPCTYKRTMDGKEILGPEVTDIVCPACGKFMVKRDGRFGTFFSCEGAPDCPTMMNLNAEGKPVVTALPTKHVCPRCGKLLLLKTARNGNRYLNCPDTKCKYATDADEKGDPVIPPDTGIACEKCGKPMVIKTSWRGPFLSCSGYPSCRNAKSINAEMRATLQANGVDVPAAPAKKDKAPQQTVDEPCPQCGTSPMLVRKTFRGPFLGCSKYPTCKGTKKMTPEIEAKIAAISSAPATPNGEPAF
jgi:DNA topoisomerase-1